MVKAACHTGGVVGFCITFHVGRSGGKIRTRMRRGGYYMLRNETGLLPLVLLLAWLVGWLVGRKWKKGRRSRRVHLNASHQSATFIINLGLSTTLRPLTSSSGHIHLLRRHKYFLRLKSIPILNLYTRPNDKDALLARI